ncbi:hypothetical protein [Agromyces sp. SYSU T0242]|uniref:hypothetical protein n=1 Tax=Agromyces litoreus TaxID=3158561 RepID=UPI003390810B
MPDDERGSASLEFLTVGMIMLVPLVYLVLAVGAIQSASLGVEGAARQAARVSVQTTDGASIDSVARAARVTLADYGIDEDAIAIAIDCDAACDVPGTRVTVRVEVEVALPLVPQLIASAGIGTVHVASEATQTVSRFARTS